MVVGTLFLIWSSHKRTVSPGKPPSICLITILYFDLCRNDATELAQGKNVNKWGVSLLDVSGGKISVYDSLSCEMVHSSRDLATHCHQVLGCQHLRRERRRGRRWRGGGGGGGGGGRRRERGKEREGKEEGEGGGRGGGGNWCKLA